MPKGYKKHPITGELIKAFIKVPIPSLPSKPAPTINYDELLKEYYNNIKHGVLLTTEVYLQSKGLSEGQIHYFHYDFLKTNHPNFWEEVLTLSRQHYHSNSVQIDTALIKKCIEGDPRAIKLYYERIEGWISQIPSAVTHIQLVFADGMVSGDEKNIIELKQVEPMEVVDAKDETPLLIETK